MRFPKASGSLRRRKEVSFALHGVEVLENRLLLCTTQDQFMPTSNGALMNVDEFCNDPRFQNMGGGGATTAVISGAFGVVHYQTALYVDPTSILFEYDFADGDSEVYGLGERSYESPTISGVIASPGIGDTELGLAPDSNLIQLKVYPTSAPFTAPPDPLVVEQALSWVVDNVETYNITSVVLDVYTNDNLDDSAQADSEYADELDVLRNDKNVIVVAPSGFRFYEFGSEQGQAYPAADANVISAGGVYDSSPNPFLDLRKPSGVIAGGIANTKGVDRITPWTQRLVDETVFAGQEFWRGGSFLGSWAYGPELAAASVAGIANLAQQVAETDLGRRLTVDEFESLLMSTGELINDGDDEDDNVINTGEDFRRVDMLSLADAIVAMSDDKFEVNVFTDASDMTAPGDGVVDTDLATPGRQISLRAAIEEANAQGTPVTITLPAGINQLSFPDRDLDISGDITVVGQEMGLSVINANGAGGVNDRVFEVLGGGKLTLEHVTVTGGLTSSVGAGIRVHANGELTMRDASVQQNESLGAGGGIYVNGATATIEGSLVAYNQGNSTLGGAGIYVTATATSTVEITSSIVANNQNNTAGTNPARGDDLFVSSLNDKVVKFTSGGYNLFGHVREELDRKLNRQDIVVQFGDQAPTEAAPNYIVSTQLNNGSHIAGLPLSEAIVQANLVPGDQTIWVPRGTHALTGQANVYQSGVATDIVGVGMGNTTITRDNVGRVFRAYNAAELGLSRVTVSGGNSGGSRGAGIRVEEGSHLNLTHSAVHTNIASNGGAGLFVTNSSASITDSVIAYNFGADPDGGVGLFAASSQVSISRSIVAKNFNGVGMNADRGEDIYATSKWAVQSLGNNRIGQVRTNLTDNFSGPSDRLDVNPDVIVVAVADADGNDIRAAVASPVANLEIFLPSGSFNLTQGALVVAPNETRQLIGVGAGATTIDGMREDRVFHADDGSTLELANLTVTGGKSSTSGGGILVDPLATLDLDQTTVLGNETDNQGGGIYSWFADVRMFESLVTSNKAADGGGVFLDSHSDLVSVGTMIVANDGGGTDDLRGDANTIAIMSLGYNRLGEVQNPLESSFNSDDVLEADPDLVVNTILDESGYGIVSVRDAVNSVTGNQKEIWVPAGHYVLTQNQLYIGSQDNAEIHGAGMGRTIIDAGGESRVIRVQPNATLELTRVTVTGGNASGGAGIRTELGSELNLFECAIVDNYSTTHGGGVSVMKGAVEISGSVIAGNRGSHGQGGGGLFVQWDAELREVRLDDTLIARNTNDWGGVFMGGPTPPKDVNVQSAERSVSGGDNLLGIVNASLFSGNPAPTDILNGNPRFVVTTLNNGLSDSSPSAFSLREAVASADNQEVWLPAGRFAWQDNPLLVPNVVSLTGISESASRIDARLISAETIDEIFLSPSFTHSRVSAVPLASTVQAPVGNDATWRGTTEEPALHPSGYPLLQTPVEIDAPLLTAPLHRHHGESISQDRDHNSQDQDDHWQATVDEIFQELSALV